MNTSADPCEDFFEYTCGGWVAKNPLPDDKTRISTFDQLADGAKSILKTELEQPKAMTGTVNKAKDYYASCMDTEAIDAAGTAPLDALLADMGLATPLASMTAVPAALAKLHTAGGSACFNLYVGSDDHNSSSNAVFVSQSGLSLPSRDYYVDKVRTSHSVNVRFVLSLCRWHF
jgi:putative endopeptidase